MLSRLFAQGLERRTAYTTARFFTPKPSNTKPITEVIENETAKLEVTQEKTVNTSKKVGKDSILFDLEKAARRDRPPRPYKTDSTEIVIETKEDIAKLFESIEAGERGAERHFGKSSY